MTGKFQLVFVVLLLLGCNQRMCPLQKIALQISNQYYQLGMKDSARYWHKISKQKATCDKDVILRLGDLVK